MPTWKSQESGGVTVTPERGRSGGVTMTPLEEPREQRGHGDSRKSQESRGVTVTPGRAKRAEGSR